MPTLAERILGAHTMDGAPAYAGGINEVNVDWVLANDITAPMAIDVFHALPVDRVFDPERIFLVADHFVPNRDIRSATQAKCLREFAQQNGIFHHYDVGRMGIEHVLLPELGIMRPGDLLIGADSHTCTAGALSVFATGMGSTDIGVAMATGRIWMRTPASILVHLTGMPNEWVGGKDVILHLIHQLGVNGANYAALEFGGPGLGSLSIDARLTMANMSIEAGAKAGLFPTDAITRAALPDTIPVYEALATDNDASYVDQIDIDLGAIEPLVACPHLPENVHPARSVGSVPIDQVVIGSCTNGRIEDLRTAARVLEGHSVHPSVRCIILPGSPGVVRAAVQEGLMEIFLDADVAVSTPTCGPCLGGHMGVLADGETAISTTNRNFQGRMGHPESHVYLAGPAVAAASAIAGRIVHPKEVVS